MIKQFNSCGLCLGGYTIHMEKHIGGPTSNSYEATDEFGRKYAAKCISTTQTDCLIENFAKSQTIINQSILYPREIILQKVGRNYLITDLATMNLHDLIH